MTPTPGAYLKHCRAAKRLSIADVAAAVATEPRIAQHLRAEWLEQIEADVMPATFNTIVALRRAFEFDMSILETLAAIAMGGEDIPPRLCAICSDHRGVTDARCFRHRSMKVAP